MAALIKRLRAAATGRLADTSGAELVEFALIVPLLLIVSAAIVDFGFLFRDYEIVTNAAREGARVRVLPGYTNTDAQNRANAYLTASGLTPTSAPTVTLTNIPAGGAGAPTFPAYTVVVSFDHPILFLRAFLGIIGGTFPTSITVIGSSTMRAETLPAGP